VIIGLRNISNERKYLYLENIKQEVKNINAYLANSGYIIINGLRNNISKLPEMTIGSKASDNGYLTLSQNEKVEITSHFKEPEKFIKKYTGNQDFMSGNKR